MIPGLIPTILRDTRCRRLVRSGAVCLCARIVQPQELNAQAFLEDMELIGIGGSAQSSIAAQFRSQTGGLSDGSRYSFNRYYSTDFEDLRVTMMSPMTDNFGIIWGFGTGESGNKYQTDPSLKFGFLATEPVGDNGLLSVVLTTVVGGYFRERACTADYGAIGGVQKVNCRMADSILPPAETLDYLVDQRPSDQVSISLRYRLQF